MALAPLNFRSPMLVVPAAMLAAWLVVLLGGHGRLDSLGNPLGGDFAMFHQAAKAATSGQWDKLYNEAQQQKRLTADFPGLPANTYLPYRYPPITAILLAPLGTLPYVIAWLLFISLGLFAWCISWRNLLGTGLPVRSPLGDKVLGTLVFSPILVQSLMDGQASLFWFAIAAGTYIHIQRQQFVIAGAILALAALKPNVMAILAILWIVRYPRILLGLLPSGAGLLAIMWLVSGRESIVAYVELAKHLATGTWAVETPYWKVQSLLSWTQLAVGANGRTINLWLGIGLVTLLGCWRRRIEDAESRSYHETVTLCVGLVANALFNPYTPVYDLTLLSLGMFAAFAHASRFGYLDTLANRRDVQVAWLCLWLGPILSQSLSSSLACPCQVMPLWLLSLAVFLRWPAPVIRRACVGTSS